MHRNGFFAKYLPKGWEFDKNRFFDTKAGLYWINQKRLQNEEGFDIPMMWSPPIPLFYREKLNGNVKYLVFHDSSFLILTNSDDEVYFDIDAFIEDNPEFSETENQEDKDLLEFASKSLRY